MEVGLPLLGAYGVMTLANALFVSLMSVAVRRTRVWTVMAQALRSVGWGYLAHVVIGFLFVVLWGPVGLGPVAAVFVVGPLLVAHWTIGRAGLAFHEHQETVTSFVAALEEADPSSVGHSARVAALSESMGSVLGLGGQAAEELRYAALLHDIGFVAVRTELLTASEVGEVSYLSTVSSHPQAGVTALRGLDFLAGALPAIAHHHERWDGHGYPAGLVGEDIPRAARIIAVADAFDALTEAPDGPGLDPSEALGQLQSREGTHLDPDVVRSLAVVVARWRGAARPRHEDSEPRRRAEMVDIPGRPTLPNHDLPEVSDAFAHWQPEASGRRA
ncbi:HD-GYP domain-containing protein [Ornithinimicrobium flavum]|uniref:HD-GYP domain-containing protein n=1 Tax=Ornithinimicrobium flavum TaxID=1288636 RepID=UPI00106F13C2|nr:HD domain-containing phosphohydrolase [Ornithinimicrobium flavum]